jgi:glycosyltransferase involved in cell wall biosynthesis
MIPEAGGVHPELPRAEVEATLAALRRCMMEFVSAAGLVLLLSTTHPVPKILLVANTDWFLYNFRMSLADFLRGRGFEVVLVSPAGKFFPGIKDHGFPWRRWEVGRKSIAPWAELGAMRSLADIYRHESPDLVHHHTMKPMAYGTRAARSLGVPSVVNSVTGLGFVFTGTALKARLLRPLLLTLLRRAAMHPNCAWVFENDSDRRYLSGLGVVPAERSHVIEGVGVDTDRFQPSAEPEGSPVILFSGRLLWDKGVGVLVDAARILRRSHEVRVVLVGEPDPGNPTSIDRATLDAWTRDGVVEWRGWRRDMPRAYAEAHIVVLPSKGEGLPAVLLEAAASGRPIVATDIPGCRGIVTEGRNGLLVPPNDPAALAEALARLVRDGPLREAMGREGREIVMRSFGNTEINRATLAVYEGVLGARPGSSG